MRAKVRWIAVIMGILVCLQLAACGNTGGSASETASEKPIAVNTAAVQKSDIRTELSFTGQVKAAKQIMVMSRVQGKVDQVMVDTGDHVVAGDVLFTMDETDLRNNIKALEAQLSTANAAVRAAQTGVSIAGGGGSETAIQTELLMEQRELGLQQAQMALDNAKKSYKDAEELYGIGAISKFEFEMSETALKNAEIGTKQATSAVEQARSTYSESLIRARDGLAQAIAQRDSLAVSLEAASDMLDHASVTAPISGIISARNVEPQAMLLTNAAPVIIVSVDTVLVNVNVTETIVNKIELGQKVSVDISAASEKPFSGVVSIVSPAASELTAAFTIEISLDNREGLLKPGMFAEAYFVMDESIGAVVIPRSTVLTEEGNAVVYVAEGERAVRREVTTGIDTGVEIEITSGLTTQDMLIVRGQTYVKDGTLIRIIEDGGGAS